MSSSAARPDECGCKTICSHVLDEITMPWAVDMRVMAVLGLVFDMGCSNSDTSCSLFRCLVNHIVVDKLVIAIRFSHSLGDGGSKCSLSVVDMSCKVKRVVSGCSNLTSFPGQDA